MKNIFVFYFLFQCLLVSSQNYPARTIVSESNYVKLYNHSENKIEGSRYLNKHWNSSAIVKSKTDKIYNLLGVNFDIDKQSFFVSLSKDTIFKVDNDKIKSVEFNNATFKRINNVFYEVLTEEGITLLKKYSLTMVKGVINSITKEKVIPDRLKVTENYFIRKKDGSLEKIKLKKKSLINLLKKDKQVIVKEYVKKNKLSYKKEKDVKKIVKYYNSLE